MIEHAVIHVYVNHDGQNNLPQIPSQSGSHTNVFDLAIQHVAIVGGELNYNDRKTPLDADLHDLATDVTFDATGKRYKGTISYENGHIQYGQYASLPHGLNARFTATPSLFALDSATLQVASSHLNLHAEVADYGDPRVTGNYEIQIHSQDLATLSPTLKSAGDVLFRGNVGYLSQNSRTWLGNITLSGVLSSDALSATSPDAHIELRKLEGRYRLANGSLHVEGVKAESMGGRILADVDMQRIDSNPTSRIRATLNGISLHALRQSIRKAELNQVTLSGTLDGTAEAH